MPSTSSVSPPFETPLFCNLGSCRPNSDIAESAKYFNAIETLSRVEFESIEQFKKLYEEIIAEPFPNRDFTQNFSAAENKLIEERLFSAYNFDGTFGPPQISKPLTNPAELLFTMKLYNYQSLLRSPPTDKDTFERKLTVAKEILKAAGKLIPKGKIISSCLLSAKIGNDDESKTICSQRSVSEWMNQLKSDEQNAELTYATTGLTSESDFSLARPQKIQTELSKDPEVNCFNEVILSLQKNGVSNPAFVFNEGAALYGAMVNPNQSIKSATANFRISKLYAAAEDTLTVDLQKPNVKFCNGIRYNIYTKKHKKYALLSIIEKPLTKVSANRDLIDVNSFKAYWKEQTPGFIVSATVPGNSDIILSRQASNKSSQ